VIDYPVLAISLVLGIGLGLFNFGGLWITVSRMTRARHPALMLAGSYLVRLTVLGACFILLARGGHWERILACLAGVILVQATVVRRLGRRRE
jgi:F1F0 ATPase subunit 2